MTRQIVNERKRDKDSEVTKEPSRRKPDSLTDPESRRSDEAPQRSEEWYRLLFERNPQPMWVYDLSTLQFLAVNEAAVHTYGYSHREFLSMTLRDIRPPEDIAVLDYYVLEGNAPGWAGVWKHRTKIGRDLYVEITDSHIDFEGRPAGLVSIKDVTDRFRAEETLFLQAAALQATANAIVITDKEGTIEWVNKAFERFTGYLVDEVIGENTRILKSGKQPQHFYRDLWNTIRKGDVWEGEFINRRKDGTLYNEFQTITPVRDREGEIRHFVGVKQDITQSKRAQEDLRRSEAQYRSLIQEAPYGIYRVRYDGRILMANTAMARMLGYDSPDELVGKNTAVDVYSSREARERSLAVWARSETTTQYEAEWKRKDGEKINVRLAGRALQAQEGVPQRFEVFVEDITERRLLEQQFRQAQKMEAVGRLAAGVAHDFNNLLMIISSYAEIVTNQVDDRTKVLRSAEQISEAASRASAVTRQLLAFSRQQPIQPAVLSVNALLLGIGKMLPRLLGEDIETTIDPSATGKVKADASQIEQVIMNLAVNARDAMPNGGKLIIKTVDATLDRAYATLHAASIPPGDYVMLSVSDTGMGMDLKTQARIFEPFFTTKEIGVGTGLGLATVYGIVKQSGGHIWVYSEPGKGATFKIYLPRVDESEEIQSSRIEAERVRGGSETILLVEDEEALRTVLAEFLESIGYKVLEADSGAAAVRILRDRRDLIQVLITDLVMPGLGGRDLAIEALQLHKDLVVLCVSGYADRSLDLAAFGPRMLFLQKPFNFSALAVAIRRLLDQTSPRRNE